MQIHFDLDYKFGLIFQFLLEHPEMLSRKRRNIDLSIEGEQKLYSIFIESRNKKIKIQSPTTISDPAVSVIWHKITGYPPKKIDQIQLEHKLSMSIENKVGELLEMYLAEKLEPYGWIWCSGNFVKAIDFIKLEDDNWRCLQIKNRDNTENSSSSQIRNGTSIEKWFRFYSKKTETNWDCFPDSTIKDLICEDDFIDFIKNVVPNALSI